MIVTGFEINSNINRTFTTTNDVNDAELPVWSVGDSWVYNAVISGYQGQVLDFNLVFNDMMFIVVDDSEDFYRVEVTVSNGDLSGSVSLNSDLIRIQGSLTNTGLTGFLIVDKGTIGLNNVNVTIDGFIDKLIDIPFSVNVDMVFFGLSSEHLNFSSLVFPMNVGEYWTNDLTYVSADLKVDLVPQPVDFITFVGSNDMYCDSWDVVNVGDSEFDCLKIIGSIGDKQNVWYSPAVGNIVRLDYENIHLGYGYTLDSVVFELVSTSYQYPSNPPDMPVFINGPDLLVAGENGLFEVSTVDPDDDKLRYVFDWGDRSVSHSDFVESGTVVQIENFWEAKGVYDVRVMARDKYGFGSGWSEPISVTVVNNAPDKPGPPQGPARVNFKKTHTYQAQTNDADGHDVRFLFDWGDGSTIYSDYVASGDTASASHKWRSQGTYEIRVRAIDRYGEESPWSDQIPVAVPINKNFRGLLSDIFQRLDFLSSCNLFNKNFVNNNPLFLYISSI